ncbi:vicilin-like seed storage protein At2g28490 [Typha latifolia]|uniref:vicilin-like seed storage protein At2g28490 n=1 Tax=Typha latifolia TaxID=4733 RepID=UPI003C2CCF7D
MVGAMRNQMALQLMAMLLLFSLSLKAVKGYPEELEISHDHERGFIEGGKGLFILGKPKKVVETDGGGIRVVSGYRWKADPNPMYIGFISMEPNTLLIPQYIDANLILFVQEGEAKIAWIKEDKLVEKNLKRGDVSVISGGSAFYVVNIRKSERLHIICSLDSSESLGYASYESFFIGGGSYPTSVLAGFDINTLIAALNITREELAIIMGSQKNGPIIYLNNEEEDILQYKTQMGEKRKLVADDDEEEQDGDSTWSWRKLLGYLHGKSHEHVHSSHAYNLYDENPSYENRYGWSIAIDEHAYSPLKHTRTGVYLVNLTAGSMVAPHLNPKATEYGVVLNGTGTIQVVFPNGSSAMNAKVSPGDVFWIPRYFPFCQVAAREGPLEFFGFTTSSRKNRPQFLAGASSVLRSMRGRELAAAFGVNEKQLEELVDSQSEGIILPSWTRHEEEEEEKKKKEKDGEAILIRKRVFFA